ncbi:hypothetical protein PPERSA_05784 [Pseudocohnilembus persalinus]|uniref:Uncharacterized protein n=1 Tax=Pseudocohnilembus persalinus TaxID=266149 RepID=A0A0V0QZH5_PSEPJ|nr:hypothetical protein PPERSA_05784 [Pseudocohnilembus persalinus]|eukprot:KRX07721.1 hypothetical protein PPERSA_05784 [Pseudocohnilembus persalinus]
MGCVNCKGKNYKKKSSKANSASRLQKSMDAISQLQHSILKKNANNQEYLNSNQNIIKTQYQTDNNTQYQSNLNQSNNHNLNQSRKIRKIRNSLIINKGIQFNQQQEATNQDSFYKVLTELKESQKRKDSKQTQRNLKASKQSLKSGQSIYRNIFPYSSGDNFQSNAENNDINYLYDSGDFIDLVKDSQDEIQIKNDFSKKINQQKYEGFKKKQVYIGNYNNNNLEEKGNLQFSLTFLQNLQKSPLKQKKKKNQFLQNIFDLSDFTVENSQEEIQQEQLKTMKEIYKNPFINQQTNQLNEFGAIFILKEVLGKVGVDLIVKTEGECQKKIEKLENQQYFTVQKLPLLKYSGCLKQLAFTFKQNKEEHNYGHLTSFEIQPLIQQCYMQEDFFDPWNTIQYKQNTNYKNQLDQDFTICGGFKYYKPKGWTLFGFKKNVIIQNSSFQQQAKKNLMKIFIEQEIAKNKSNFSSNLDKILEKGVSQPSQLNGSQTSISTKENKMYFKYNSFQQEKYLQKIKDEIINPQVNPSQFKDNLNMTNFLNPIDQIEEDININTNNKFYKNDLLDSEFGDPNFSYAFMDLSIKETVPIIRQNSENNEENIKSQFAYENNQNKGVPQLYYSQSKIFCNDNQEQNFPYTPQNANNIFLDFESKSGFDQQSITQKIPINFKQNYFKGIKTNTFQSQNQSPYAQGKYSNFTNLNSSRKNQDNINQSKSQIYIFNQKNNKSNNNVDVLSQNQYNNIRQRSNSDIIKSSPRVETNRKQLQNENDKQFYSQDQQMDIYNKNQNAQQYQKQNKENCPKKSTTNLEINYEQSDNQHQQINQQQKYDQNIEQLQSQYNDQNNELQQQFQDFNEEQLQQEQEIIGHGFILNQKINNNSNQPVVEIQLQGETYYYMVQILVQLLPDKIMIPEGEFQHKNYVIQDINDIQPVGLLIKQVNSSYYQNQNN